MGDDTAGRGKKKGFVATILDKLIVGFVAAIVAFVMGWVLFRPDQPWVHFTCSPMEGPAPLAIECSNESVYAREVHWSFGDNTAAATGDRVQHTYEKAGTYTVTLTGLGKKNATVSREIVVREAAPDAGKLATTLVLDLSGVVRGQVIRQARRFEVNETKSDHPVMFSSSSRDYAREFRPDEGARFVGAHFVEQSANYVENRSLTLAEDGSVATLTFSLTSGPKVDQYRGWLSGVVEAVQETAAPDQVVTLASSLSITRPGIYPLESRITLDSLTEVTFHGSDGTELGTTRIGEVLILDDQGVALSLATAGQRPVLRVDSLGG